MNQITKKPQISILFFLISFANVLALLYSAALPKLTEYFQISKEQSQLTIAFYLLGYALGLPIYAPLAKSYGRKTAIYIGTTVAVFGSLICILSIELLSLPLLFFGRMVTALGASVGLVLTLIIVGDSFAHAYAKKKLSFLIGGFALFPALTIALGGFLTQYFSWKSCFLFMLGYSFFVKILAYFLPETAANKERHHLKLKTIMHHYWKEAKHLLFIFCSLIMAGAGLIIYLFSAEAPFIAINQLKISAANYGLYNIIPNIGLFLGGIASAYYSHQIHAKKMVLIGAIAFLFFSITMLVCFKIGFINTFTLFVLPACIFFSGPAIIANSSALALAVSEDHSYASSLMSAIQIFLIFLSFFFLTLSSQKAVLLPLIYTMSGIWIILIWLFMKPIKTDLKR